MSFLTNRPSSRVARWGVALAAAMFLGLFSLGPAGADTKRDLAAAKDNLAKLIDQISAEARSIQGLEADIAPKANALALGQGQLDATHAPIVKLQSDSNTPKPHL